MRRERLGMNPDQVEYSQYLDISPLVMAVLASLAIVRFNRWERATRDFILLEVWEAVKFCFQRRAGGDFMIKSGVKTG